MFVLSLLTLQASCMSTQFARTSQQERFDNAIPFSVITQYLYEYVMVPIYLIAHDEDCNRIIDQGLTVEAISKLIKLDQSYVEQILEYASSLISLFTLDANMNVVYSSFGLMAEEVKEIADKIKKAPAYLDIPLKDIFGSDNENYDQQNPQSSRGITYDTLIQIITPISQYWNLFAPAFSALNLNEKNINATLSKIITYSNTITISDILASLGLNKDKAVSTLNNLADLMSSSKATISDGLAFIGIRDSTFEEMIGSLSKALAKRSATKEEIKEILLSRAIFDSEAIGLIFENISDIVVSTLGTFITKDKFTIVERANMLAKSFNSYKELLGENTPKCIDTACLILTNFSKDGVDIKALLNLDEDKFKVYNRIVNFAKKLLDGKANFYDVYNFTLSSIYTEDHLTERVFKLLKDAKSTMKLIINAVDSLNDIIIGFLTTMLQLNDKMTMSCDYQLFERNEFSYFSIENNFFGKAFNKISKYLTKTNIELFSMYNNNTKLINEEFINVFNEGIKVLSTISTGIIKGIVEGKTIEKSLQECLMSIKTSEYEHLIAYLIEAVDPSNSSLDENIKDDIKSILIEIRQSYNESSNLNEFYNKVYDINWMILIDDIGNDENISRGIMNLFPADKIYNSSINDALSLLINKYGENNNLYYKSAAQVIIGALSEKNEYFSVETESILRFIDFFVTIMTDGKLTPYDYNDIINYVSKMQVFKRVFDALASNDGSKAMTKFKFDYFYDVINSIIKSVDELGFKLSSILIRVFEPYKWIAKKFIDGFSGRDFYDIISKDIEPSAISNTFNLFIKYVEPLKTNSSLQPVLKELLGYDAEKIISPINETLKAIHSYLKYDEELYNHFYDIKNALEVFNRLSSGNEYNLRLLFGIEHSYYNCAEALNYIIDILRNKKYLQVDKEDAMKILEPIKRVTEKMQSEFDSEFTFKSFIDNNNFVFSDLFKKIATGYGNNESVSARIESLNLTTLSIEPTLNNLCSFSDISYLDFIESFTFKTNAGNDELISFATSFDAATTTMNVSDLNALVGYDLGKQTDAITTSTNSPVSYLPEKEAILSQSNLKVLSNVVSQVDSGKLNSEAVDSAIKQIIENSKHNDDSKSESGKLTTVQITFIVIGSVAAVTLIAVVIGLLIHKRKNNRSQLTQSLSQQI